MGDENLLPLRVINNRTECLLSVLPLTSSDFPLTPASDSTPELHLTKPIASNLKVRGTTGVGEGLFQKIEW